MSVSQGAAVGNGWSSPARRPRSLAVRALGPAFVAAVAYVDPGNIATNTSAGSLYGFALLWVVVLATVMAGPVQYLSAKLGAATGFSLPQLVARRTRRSTRLVYWGQAELVAIATDIAEVVGAAVAMQLLWGVPLLLGGAIAALVSTILLLVHDRLGPRVLQGMSLVSLLVIGGGFAIGLLSEPPHFERLAGGLLPSLGSSGMVLLAAGIVGATVMPHAIYLHSSLTRPRDQLLDLRTRLRTNRIDVVIAMLVAGSINISMLVLGASALGGHSDQSLGGFASGLTERVSSAASTGFLVALLVSGLSSTAVGTQAGTVIMDGLLRRRVPIVVRRLVTVAPALLLLGFGASPIEVLVLSQVVLALGLPFALIPLLRLTGSRAVVGDAVNSRPLTLAAGLIVTVVIGLDLALVVLTFA